MACDYCIAQAGEIAAFGEIALIYNQPRTSTSKSTSNLVPNYLLDALKFTSNQPLVVISGSFLTHGL